MTATEDVDRWICPRCKETARSGLVLADGLCQACHRATAAQITRLGT